MEGILVYIFVLGGILTLMLLVYSVRHRQHSGRALRAVANRFRGVAVGGGVFTRPTLRFRYGTTFVIVSYGRRQLGHQPTTEVQIRWDDMPFQCEIALRDSGQPRRLPNLPELDLGTPDFQRSLRVASNQPEIARPLLNAAVQLLIRRLWNYADWSEVRLVFHRGWLTIAKLRRLNTAPELEQFVQLCLELHDQALLTRSFGIEFLGGSEATIIEDVACPVCGEPIGEDLVFCRRCKTPHHFDCWQYYGACSTYGCQETQYAVPRIAADASQQPAPPADEAHRQT